MSRNVERFRPDRHPARGVNAAPPGAPGTVCRGCDVALAGSGEPWCRDCLGPTAVQCDCGESWSLERVPEVWPVCPKCRRRNFLAYTASAAIAVVES